MRVTRRDASAPRPPAGDIDKFQFFSLRSGVNVNVVVAGNLVKFRSFHRYLARSSLTFIVH